MTFWILAALITGGATGFVTTTLRPASRNLANTLTFAVPILALGLYFLLGNPSMP